MFCFDELKFMLDIIEEYDDLLMRWTGLPEGEE